MKRKYLVFVILTLCPAAWARTVIISVPRNGPPIGDVTQFKIEGLRPNELKVIEGAVTTLVTINEKIGDSYRQVGRTVAVKTSWATRDKAVVYTLHDSRIPTLKQPSGWRPVPSSLEIVPGKKTFSVVARPLRYDTDVWHKLYRGQNSVVQNAKTGWRIKAGGKIIALDDADILKVSVNSGVTTVTVGAKKSALNANRLLIWYAGGQKPKPIHY